MLSNSAQTLQKQVDKQKKEAQKKFTSWLFHKFKREKKQFIRDQEEHAAEAERLRRQKQTVTESNAKSGGGAMTSSSTGGDGPVPLQRQRSFLRSQLLEMKRQSQEMLLNAKNRVTSQREDDETDGEHDNNSGEDDGDVDETKPTEGHDDDVAKMEMSEETDNVADEEEKTKEACVPVDETTVTTRLSESNQDEHESGSKRNSVSDDFDRRMTHATLLYEEAIHALDEALHPSTQPSGRPSQIIVTRKSRAASTSNKGVFARPESEWI